MGIKLEWLLREKEIGHWLMLLRLENGTCSEQLRSKMDRKNVIFFGLKINEGFEMWA